MNAWKKILKEWILPLGAEVLVIVFLLKVVFMLVLVPSGSMLPTIQKNSILFCTYIHDISQVERGQILVFESDEIGKTLIKRLVGLPGETVAIREDGTVTVDGQVLDESYVVYPQMGERWSLRSRRGTICFWETTEPAQRMPVTGTSRSSQRKKLRPGPGLLCGRFKTLADCSRRKADRYVFMCEKCGCLQSGPSG